VTDLLIIISICVHYCSGNSDIELHVRVIYCIVLHLIPTYRMQHSNIRGRQLTSIAATEL
jgi:hypothetical protein